MAEEINVKVNVDAKEASKSVDNLGKSFSTLDSTVKKTQEKQADYGKQIIQSSQLSQKLSQATGGLSDAFMGAVKGIDMSNLSLKAMKGAIMSTGVGVLVIALGELITMLADFYSSEKKSEKAVESMNNALERQNQLFDEQEASLNQNIKVQKLQAEIAGANAKELVELDRKALKERIALNDKFIQTQLENMDKLRNNNEISTEDYIEQSKKLDAELEKGLIKQVELKRSGTIATLENQKKEGEEATKLKEEAEAKSKAISDKAKADLIQQKQSLKSLEQKYADDIENMQDTTAQQKLDRQKERAIEELNKIKLDATAKKEALRLIDEDFNLKQELLEKSQNDKLLALSNQFAKEREDILAVSEEDKLNLKIQRATLALETELATMVSDEEKKNELRMQLDANTELWVKELEQKKKDEANVQKQTDNLKIADDNLLEFEARRLAVAENDRLIDEQTNLTAQQRIDAHLANKEKTKEIDQQELDWKARAEEQKNELVKKGFDVLTGLTTMMLGNSKKSQQLQKGLTLAQIGIDTATAFSKLMAGSESAAVATGPAYPFTKPIFYATGLIQILSNVAKAKAALSGSGGGGGGGGASTPTLPPAPTFNVVGTSGENQIAQSLAGQNQRPIEAFVVSNNVTTAQGLDRNIINNATLG
jgi:hypothetical protein